MSLTSYRAAPSRVRMRGVVGYVAMQRRLVTPYSGNLSPSLDSLAASVSLAGSTRTALADCSVELDAPRGCADILELGYGELAGEITQATIGGSDQATAVDMAEDRAEPA